MKETAASMENITYTMVIHKNLYGEETIFSTMSGPLVNNPPRKWLVVIRRGTYQAAAEDIRWAYEPVAYFCPDVEPVSDSSDDLSNGELSKDMERPDDQ